MNTQGHLNYNGGLRGHSVGEVFPFIVFAKGFAPTTWHILTPKGEEVRTRFNTARLANEFARYLKSEWSK